MTAKRIPPPPSVEVKPSAGLPADHLETLPIPSSEAMPPGIEGTPEAPQIESEAPVGYCSPPQHTRWQKGAPSPNPKGRPPKPPSGVLMKKMELLIEVNEDGVLRQMTRRAYLDRLVRDKAMSEGGPWLKLWEQRKLYDAVLRQRVAEYQARRAKETPADKEAAKRRSSEASRDATYAWIEQNFAGVHEVERKLLEAGVIVETPEGLALGKGWEVGDQDDS